MLPRPAEFDLSKLEAVVEKALGIEISLAVKEMTDGFDISMELSEIQPYVEKEIISEDDAYVEFKKMGQECETMEDLCELKGLICEFMNKNHILIKQAKTYILREKIVLNNENKETFELMPSDHSNMILNYYNKIIYTKFKGKDDHEFSLYDAWIKHPSRRAAFKMVFHPKNWKTPVPDLYNTYRGLAIEKDTLDDLNESRSLGTLGIPNPIEDEEYFKHIRHRWCGGNLDLYNKVLDFFASILQRPWYKMKMCIVLKSAERTGKGLPIQIFKEILGSNYFFQPSSADEILGNFNANLGSKLLCFIDEMVWGGDKSKAGCLKKLVTESEFTLKQKYMPDQIMNNSINLIMASNEEWVIPGGTTDTRWLVLEVSDELAQMTDKTAKKKIIATSKVLL